MKVEKISINGQIKPVDAATISVTDQGLMYGVGAFESFRVHSGQVFLLDEHLDRLSKSLRVLGIKPPTDRQTYCRWIGEICDEVPADKDAFVRLLVLGGQARLGISEDELDQPNVVIYVGYIPSFIPIEKRAIVLSSVTRNKPEYFANLGFRIKAPDYLSARIAKQELATWEAKNNSDKSKTTVLDGIELTPDGYVAEGLTANVFWVKNGQLYTPPLDIGILAGTMRDHIMASNQVQEVLAKPEELEQADEVIFTAGASFLSPIAQLNGIKKPGKDGPVFKSLYSQLTTAVNNNSTVL